MKTKVFMLALVAGAMVVASCSKSNDPEPTSGNEVKGYFDKMVSSFGQSIDTVGIVLLSEGFEYKEIDSEKDL